MEPDNDSLALVSVACNESGIYVVDADGYLWRGDHYGGWRRLQGPQFSDVRPPINLWGTSDRA